MITNKILFDHLQSLESSLQSVAAKNSRHGQSVLFINAKIDLLRQLKEDIPHLAALSAIFMQEQDNKTLFTS